MEACSTVHRVTEGPICGQSQRHHSKGRTQESSKPQGLGMSELFLDLGLKKLAKSSYSESRGTCRGLDAQWDHHLWLLQLVFGDMGLVALFTCRG